MFHINLQVLLADLGLGLIIASAAPFYAVVLTVGWEWRLWRGIVNLAMSFAIYTLKPVSIS